jgi:hypothetical protein
LATRWIRLGDEVKLNQLNGSASGARTILASHIFAMARKGERNLSVSSTRPERSVAHIWH